MLRVEEDRFGEERRDEYDLSCVSSVLSSSSAYFAFRLLDPLARGGEGDNKWVRDLEVDFRRDLWER